MARAQFAENLKEVLTCSVCTDYFRHPVTLGCGHSFCHLCLLNICGEADGPSPCPLCRKHFHVRDLEYNQHLGKLASIGNSLRPYLLQLEEEKVICERHQEEKNLFCEKDQSFLCLYCFQSQEHINHTVHTVQKAAEDSRGKLQKILHLLQKEMETVQNMLTEEIEKEKTWKEKVQAWRESMAAEYRRLHELLNKEEKLHSQAMVHQEKNNQKNVRESDTRLSQYFHSLKAVMADVEQHSWKNNTQLLQVVGGILTRYESLLGHPPETVTTLGILFLNTMMWEMLKHFKVDVTLDPQNVSPHFILSDDLRTVIPRGNQQNSHFSFSQHANNFTLGTQFFASGIYYWEVEVGDCRQWAVGVCKETLRRVEVPFLGFEDVFLLACIRKGNRYTLMTTPPYFEHQVDFPIHRVGILLDCDEGTISFYNASERCFIYRFPQFPFSGLIQPIFSPCPPVGEENGIPMTIGLDIFLI